MIGSMTSSPGYCGAVIGRRLEMRWLLDHLDYRKGKTWSNTGVIRRGWNQRHRRFCSLKERQSAWRDWKLSCPQGRTWMFLERNSGWNQRNLSRNAKWIGRCYGKHRWVDGLTGPRNPFRDNRHEEGRSKLLMWNLVTVSASVEGRELALLNRPNQRSGVFGSQLDSAMVDMDDTEN